MILILYPEGDFFEIPTEVLNDSPFDNFLIPGIILLVLLGLFPLFVFITLILKPDWHWVNRFNVYSHHHFSWTFALYSSIILVLWMNFQFMFIGCGDIIQTIYSFIGIGMIMLTLVPSVIRYYSIQNP